MPRWLPTFDRFWQKVEIVPSGCWEWKGSKINTNYGMFWFENKRILAHRYTFQQVYGQIPEGLEIDHLCRNRACVNPLHLEAVNHQVNCLRGIRTKGNIAKICCHKGHPFDEENTYITPDGRRQCRICRLERQQKYSCDLKEECFA